MKIGFALTSSYCTLEKVLLEIKNLVDCGYDVIPIVQPSILNTDTRFGKGEYFKNCIEKITNNKIVSTIVDAEKFGPAEPLDALVIAPATGNFIAKLANGITDNPVCMATKATIRNGSPIIIGVSTNDALGINGVNIMRLLNTKGIYFIPFYQDDHIKKPNSLIANYELLTNTLESALKKEQLQPVLDNKVKIKKLEK